MKKSQIIRKSQEREALIDQAKKRASSGVYGFGSRVPRNVCDTNIDYSKRAVSQGNLLRSPASATEPGVPGNTRESVRVQRRAVSACSLARKAGPAERNGMLHVFCMHLNNASFLNFLQNKFENSFEGLAF